MTLVARPGTVSGDPTLLLPLKSTLAAGRTSLQPLVLLCRAGPRRQATGSLARLATDVVAAVEWLAEPG